MSSGWYTKIGLHFMDFNDNGKDGVFIGRIVYLVATPDRKPHLISITNKNDEEYM